MTDIHSTIGIIYNYKIKNPETPLFIMLCGIPGTGKTFVRDLIIANSFGLENSNFVTLSTDSLIETCAKDTGQTYGAVFSSVIKESEKAMNRHLDAVLAREHKDNIIWDQTNVSVKTRKKKLSRIPEDYYKICVAISPLPVDMILKINETRKNVGRDIPIPALKSMIYNWQMPTESEGFDFVIDYHPSTDWI